MFEVSHNELREAYMLKPRTSQFPRQNGREACRDLLKGLRKPGLEHSRQGGRWETEDSAHASDAARRHAKSHSAPPLAMDLHNLANCPFRGGQKGLI